MSKVIVFANTSYLQNVCKVIVSGRQSSKDDVPSNESMGYFEYDRYSDATTPVVAQMGRLSSCTSGVVTCHVDKDAGGDITSITVGHGLSGGGVSGDISIAIDYAKVQKQNPECRCAQTAVGARII